MEAYSQEYHRALGAHSNIPPCCIEYWVEGWPINQRGWNYVPCNHCVTKENATTTHSCSHECFDFLKSIGLSNEKIIFVIINNVIIGAEPFRKYIYVLDYRMGRLPAPLV